MMKMHFFRRWLWIGLLCVLHPGEPVSACSTFFILRNGCMIFGRNYDWMVEDGYLMVNKRGVKKTSLVIDRSTTWRSRYGSVTFNQYGRDFPIGGMNEAGLVVENMWLDEARYPRPDDRGAVNCLQWVQYQLDTSATVDDVMASDRTIRISQLDPATLHYLVADRRGQCAVIEFLDGKMSVHRKADGSAMALTNDTYRASIHYLREHRGFGGDSPIPSTTRSLDRFVRSLKGAQECRAVDAAAAVDDAFQILDEVAQGDFTKWSIVYDLAHGRVHFRTRMADRKRFVDASQLDYSCSQPVLMLDLSKNQAGNVTGQLVPYNADLNRTLVLASCAKTPFLSGVPMTLLELVAKYPGTTTCEGSKTGEESEPVEAAAEPVGSP